MSSSQVSGSKKYKISNATDEGWHNFYFVSFGLLFRIPRMGPGGSHLKAHVYHLSTLPKTIGFSSSQHSCPGLQGFGTQTEIHMRNW